MYENKVTKRCSSLVCSRKAEVWYEQLKISLNFEAGARPLKDCTFHIQTKTKVSTCSQSLPLNLNKYLLLINALFITYNHMYQKKRVLYTVIIYYYEILSLGSYCGSADFWLSSKTVITQNLNVLFDYIYFQYSRTTT